MLKTKKLFVLNETTLESAKVQEVLRTLNKFKAVECVQNVLNLEESKYIFAKNKSIICTRISEQIQEEKIEINLVNYQTDSFFDINVKENIKKQFEEIAKQCEIDIGDYVEGDPHSDPDRICEFCAMIKDEKSTYNQATIFSTTNFIVFTTVGAFVPGYLIIIPKAHIFSMGGIEEEHVEELEYLTLSLRDMLKDIYGKEVLIWENGSGTELKGKPATSVVHAHIHLCCVNGNITEKIEEYKLEFKEIELNEILKYVEKPYLFLWEKDDRKQILQTDKVYIPRQFVRQLIADGYGLPEGHWNWRKYNYLENFKVTENNLANFFNKVDMQKYFEVLIEKYNFTSNKEIFK